MLCYYFWNFFRSDVDISSLFTVSIEYFNNRLKLADADAACLGYYNVVKFALCNLFGAGP